MITFTVNAEIPFIPEVDDRLDTLEGMTGDISLSKAAGYGGAITSSIGAGLVDTTELANLGVTEAKLEATTASATGLYVPRVARIEFTASGLAAGDYNMGAGLIPANAMFDKIQYHQEVTTVSASDNTVALLCDSVSLVSAVDLTDDAADFVRTVTSTAMADSSGCTPIVRIGAGATGITAHIIYFIRFLGISE